MKAVNMRIGINRIIMEFKLFFLVRNRSQRSELIES